MLTPPAMQASPPTRIAIPGIGPIVATAIVAAIGNGAAFGKATSCSGSAQFRDSTLRARPSR